MGAITRDRLCLYYVPWIATFLTAFVAAGLGVWVNYVNVAKGQTLDGLDALGVVVTATEHLDPSLLGTAIAYICVVVILFGLSVWRSFIEAGHDATGRTGGAATALLVLNAIFNTLWWLMVVWLVLLCMGCSVWAVMLDVSRKACSAAIASVKKYPPAPWSPSSGKPCPGQCLNLTVFSFVSSALQDACICDALALATAEGSFTSAFSDNIPGVLAGIWAMFLGGLCLLLNVACQFSHTKRERELLSRIQAKHLVANP